MVMTARGITIFSSGQLAEEKQTYLEVNTKNMDIDMSADGLNKDGKPTYTITIDKKTHKCITMEEVIELIQKSEEKIFYLKN